MKKANILVFSKRPFHNSPRIIREIEALKNEFNVYAVGETEPSDNSITFENIYNQRTIFDKVINSINYYLLKFKANNLVIPKFSKLKKFIIKNNITLLIIHEPIFLPLAIDIKRQYNVKVVFNAHEYHPLEFEDQAGWLDTIGIVYDGLYRNYLSKLDLLVNVCNGIAHKCLKEYNVPSIVIPNAAFYSETPIHYAESSSNIKMIYHGAILESRKIEDMIKVAEILGENYVLDIMGTGTDYNKEYFQKLSNSIVEIPNVFFRKPVPFEEIVSTINKYDLGIYILAPNGFNNEYALPNKIFEYIQAKLAIAISPSKEMRNIVEKYNLGVVADDFSPESLADKIKSLTKEKIAIFKKNSEKASKIENAEKYKEFYLSSIKKLIN